MNEKDLTRLNDGRLASYTLNGMNPVFSKQEELIISRLKNLARGEWDGQKAFALVTTLCSIEDMANDLRQKINLAEKVSKKEDNS